MKVKRILFLFVSLLVIGLCLVTNFDEKNYEKEDDFEDMFEDILDESQIKVNDYINVENAVYRSQLIGEQPEINHLKLTFNSETGGVDLAEEQKEEVLNAVKKVFNDMTEEEYEAFASLGEENPEIAELIDLLNEDVEEADGLTETSFALAGTLSSAGLSDAIIKIFEAAVVALKAAKYAIIPYIIAAIAATAIVILTVIIVNHWAQIKSIINKIIDFFASTVSKAAKYIKAAFNAIVTTAKAAEATAELKSQMAKSTSIGIVSEYDLALNPTAACSNPDWEIVQKGIIVSTVVKVLEANKDTRIYQFAYVKGRNIEKLNYKMTYLEACSVLAAIDLCNVASDKIIPYASMTKELQLLTDNIKELISKNEFTDKTMGIYTNNMKDAAALAYVFGAWFLDSKLGNNDYIEPDIQYFNMGDGTYMYHFHDIKRKIHVWFSNK